MFAYNCKEPVQNFNMNQNEMQSHYLSKPLSKTEVVKDLNLKERKLTEVA